MRRILPVVLVLVMPWGCERSGQSVAAAATGTEMPVLIELFTSEGCSSCPPADELLRTLVTTQPIPGVQIIALSEHVEYWNRLGWRDPFSAPIFTERQTQYQAEVFRTSPVYTPQLVVDGTHECIGSDTAAVRRAITAAAHAPKADVRIAVDAEHGTPSITVDVSVPATVTRSGDADVVVTAIEDGLSTDVRRGENRGRTLRHDAVVRQIQVVGTLSAQARDGSFSTTVPLADGWDRSRVRFVAFVQERGSRTVIGVSSRLFDSPRVAVSGHARQGKHT